MTAAVIVAICFGIPNLALGLVAWWRARRAAELAERAEARANVAESRAEEAHAILKTRFASDQEYAEAELEAPGIAEIWAAQVVQGRRNRAEDGGNVFNIYVDVPTRAHRMALELLRARTKELYLSRVAPSGGSPTAKWVIVAYTEKAIIRMRLDE